MVNLPSPFLLAPCVFIAGEGYQIAFNATQPCLAWVDVDGQTFFDQINGVARTDTRIHKVTVPRRTLDAAKAYTVCLQPMLERKPYFPQGGPIVCHRFAFEPPDLSEGLRLYMISDTHSRTEEPVEAGRYFGAASHLLVLNGDIADKSSSIENILTLYRLNDALTGGERPILFARGNHDTRGACAEHLMDYMGLEEGRTYFTFRIGPLWGLVLDCGEDKLDRHEEYGGTARFEAFRREETAFLERVLSERGFADPDIRYRICVCHIPFAYWPEQVNPIFRIEQDLYARWTAMLNQMGIDVLLSGHWHRQFVVRPGDPGDGFGMRFPVVVGSSFLGGKAGQPGDFGGAAVTMKEGALDVRFTDNHGAVLEAFAL